MKNILKNKYIDELKFHASYCQEQADEMAFELVNQSEAFENISVFQSRCDFNLFWVYQISPEVFIHLKTISFLKRNIEQFRRNITLKELIRYDYIITKNEIKTFNDFIKKVK